MSPRTQQYRRHRTRHSRMVVLIAGLSATIEDFSAVSAVSFQGSLEVKFAFSSRSGDAGGSSDTITVARDTIDVVVSPSTMEDASIPKSKSCKYNFPLCQPGDGSESDPDGLPGRFLRMQKGDREKAKASFQSTLEWRVLHEVDTILGRPHQTYDICKEALPHYFAGRDPTGHVVFVQHPNRIDFTLAKNNSVDTHELLMHWVYVLEYCWNIIEPRPDQTMTSVIDLKGVHFGTVMDTLPFVKQFVSMMSSHFPQRSHKTLLINTPRWFGTLYRLLSPLLRESTKAKIAVHHGGKKQDAALRTHLGGIAPTELMSHTKPLDDALRSDTGQNSPMEHDLRAFCMARLSESGQEMQVVIR